MREREKEARKERKEFPHSFPELIFCQSGSDSSLFSVDFAFAI